MFYGIILNVDCFTDLKINEYVSEIFKNIVCLKYEILLYQINIHVMTDSGFMTKQILEFFTIMVFE